MGAAWNIVLCGLLLASVATGVYYGVALWRIVRGQMTQPTLRLARRLLAKQSAWPRLAVVVPAHNEEAVIEQCVRTLVDSDYPELRIIFALDRCTDGTYAVIQRVVDEHGADERIDVRTIEHCPDDWAGKTHALHRGYHDSLLAADAELVLFCDADTSFEPDALGCATALLLDRKIDLLSLLPTLTCARWFEWLVQPAAGLELIRQFPLDKVNAPGARRHFANGQFMLWRREAFDAIGGHARVQTELLEDIALARMLHKPMPSTGAPSPYRAGCFMADGLMRCRMYAHWEAFRRGWKRIYAEAARRYPGQIRKHARRVRIVGAVLPVLAVAAVFVGALSGGLNPGLARATWVGGVVAIVLFLCAIGLVYRAQRLVLPWVLLYPIGAWRVGGIMHEAARDLERDTPTTWAGRSYQRARAPKSGGAS